jgi:Branched-chain amino acid aminotransferase/4-amino-4-deoxychorismate lyase
MNKLVWFDGKITKSYNEISVPLLSQGLQYGFAAFEGIRARKFAGGSLIFRLADHIKRLYHSTSKLYYQIEDKFAPQEIQKACQDVLAYNQLQEAYIRPIVYFGDAFPGLTISKDNIHLAVLVVDFPANFSDGIKIGVAETRKDRRNIIVDVKGSGQYQIFTYERQKTRNKGFDDAFFLDNDGNIAEGVGSNIFLTKGQTLYTPPLENILPGITRDSILKIAFDLGYNVAEKHIPYSAIGDFDEAFFTGTAVGIVPIKQIDTWEFKSMRIGKSLQNYYLDITTGKVPKYQNWLTQVNPQTILV